MSEIWKDVVGYEGKYQVSNMGNIRTLEHYIEYKQKSLNKSMKKFKEVLVKRKIKAKIKKPTIGNHGYPVVNLGLSDTHTVHSLVANAFIIRVLGKNHVDHINSIRHDNRVENLQWVTQQENNSKQTFCIGSNKHNAVLIERDIVHIRDEYFKNDCKRGLIAKIANGYGVNSAVIRDVVRNITWKHVGI